MTVKVTKRFEKYNIKFNRPFVIFQTANSLAPQQPFTSIKSNYKRERKQIKKV